MKTFAIKITKKKSISQDKIDSVISKVISN